MKIDEKNLERALKDKGKAGISENSQTGTQKIDMTKDQEIAFHQGALSTLASEHDGLMQMISVVERRIQAHLKRLEELGVKIQRQERK